MSDGAYLESIVLGGQKLTIRDPNASHDATSIAEIVNVIYPIGSIIMRYDNINPNTYLGVGSWEMIQSDRYIRTSNSGGDTGGSNTVNIGVNNLPQHSHTAEDSGKHNHAVSVLNAGGHTHTITVEEAGAHTHPASSESAGAHNHYLKGYDGLGASGSSGIKLGGNGTDQSGAICVDAGAHTHEIGVDSSGTHNHTATMTQSGTHTHTASTNRTGEHTHVIGNTGGGESLEVTPAYITLAVWRRTA